MINNLPFAGKLRAGKLWVTNHPVRAATFAGWFQQGVTGLSAVLVIPILLTNLGAEATGIWLSFQGFVMLAGLADFGVGIAVTRQAAHCLGSDSSESSSGDFLWFGKGWDGVLSLWQHASAIYRVTVVIAFLFGILVYETIVVHTKLTDGDASAQRLLWILMLTVPCMLLFAGRSVAIVNGVGCILYTRVFAGLYFGAQTILLIGAAIWTKSILMMAATSVIITLAYSAGVTIFAKAIIKEKVGERSVATWNTTLCLSFLKVALPLGFVNLGAFLTTSVQVPLVGAILGPASVAPFFLAQKIAQFSIQAALQFSAPKTISFSELVGKRSFEMAHLSMQQTLRKGWLLVFTSQILFVFVLSPLAPMLLAGKEYPSFLVIFLLGFDYALMGSVSMVGQFVLAFGKNPFLWSTLASGILNLSLLFILTPKFGLVGIPAASILAGLLTNYWVNPLWGFRILRSLKLKRTSIS